MNQEIEFITHYISEAHRVDCLAYKLGSYDAQYQQERLPVTQMWADPANGHPTIYLSGNEKLNERSLEALIEPTLLRADSFEHETYGTLTFFIVSANSKKWGEMGYRYRWCVQTINETLKIVREDSSCLDCFSLGSVSDQQCQACNGLGWIFVRGLNFENPGTFKETKLFNKPKDSRFIPAWNMTKEK